MSERDIMEVFDEAMDEAIAGQADKSIIERLIDQSNHYANEEAQLLEDAAAEIQRLTEENAELKGPIVPNLERARNQGIAEGKRQAAEGCHEICRKYYQPLLCAEITAKYLTTEGVIPTTNTKEQ